MLHKKLPEFSRGLTVCADFGHADKRFSTDLKIETIEDGTDYKLFSIKMFEPKKVDSSSIQKPFSGVAQFVMEETYSHESTPQEDIYGNWVGVGYFSGENYYSLFLPFDEVDFTIYKSNGKNGATWFQFLNQEWSKVNDIKLNKITKNSITLEKYVASILLDFDLETGFYFGRVVQPEQKNKFFDFEGLIWGAR